MKYSQVTYHHKDGTKTLAIRTGLGIQTQNIPGLEYDCRKADCGICIFRVMLGAENISTPTPAERDFLRAMHAAEDERLACQCRVFGDIEIEIPDLGP